MNGTVVTYQGTAYPADCDHMGHMNVAAYTRKFDEGTWMLWAQVGFTRDVLGRENKGLAAVKADWTYSREVAPGDPLRVRSRFLARSNRSATFEHQMMIVDADGAEAPAARVCYTVACFDRTARKAVPFPDAIAARIDAALMPEETSRSEAAR